MSVYRTIGPLVTSYNGRGGWSGENMGHCPLAPKEIDGLLVQLGKSYVPLTCHLIIG